MVRVSVVTSVTRSPSSSRTCASSPHSGGGWAPGGGGGAKGFMVANIWPMKPAGVQLSSPIRPPGADHADQLVGGDLVVRGEHHADAGDRGVELGVGVRQRLRVGDLPAQLRADPLGRLAAGLDQVWGQVAGDHVRASQGGGDGGVAGAGGDVEDAVTRQRCR